MIDPTTPSGDLTSSQVRRPASRARQIAPSADVERRIPRTADADKLPDPVADVVPRTRSELLCRIVNVVIASLALLVLAPVMLLVAMAIKLNSRGPIMYTQTRIGIDKRWNRWNRASALYDRRIKDLGGEVFRIYKFRSMYIDAEARSGAVWATKSDPRITPVGRFIRKTRLDELPQLFNVVGGTMNIVGPRPERPTIFLRLAADIAEYPMRQRIKPGITGWAQINHAYDSCIDDVRTKVRYDLEYLTRQGLAEDLRIMARTVPVMLLRKGAV